MTSQPSTGRPTSGRAEPSQRHAAQQKDSAVEKATERPEVSSQAARRVSGELLERKSRLGSTMCPTGSTLQITRRDCRHRWTISPLPLNAERRLPRSTVLVATATIRVVATEGQIYGRQLQQAGDYTGPHRDRLSPNDAWRLAV